MKIHLLVHKKNLVTLLPTFLMVILTLVSCTSTETDSSTAQETAEITITVDDPLTMTFVDAHDNTYQMEIDPDVAPNSYVPDCFIRSGDRLSYEDAQTTSRIGLDVSYYQGDIDWERVKADEMEFVILRLGYRGYGSAGSLNVDSSFSDNLKGAQQAGLDVGVYFFSQAVNEEEAIEEAQFVINCLDGQDLQLPIVFDPEHVTGVESRVNTVTREQFTQNAIAFCDTVQDAGYDAMIYCNMIWQAYWLDLKELADYSIWYADYQPLPQTPYNFAFWQYTESGRVDGISGDVDLNIQIIRK
ncbi:MAG: glycoside hydrolase family 25 protein [Clostridiales bacterium]|nr:glycoside hydrolase family 25 protein [Clostridiales bacterium]